MVKACAHHVKRSPGGKSATWYEQDTTLRIEMIEYQKDIHE
jgi:hypothetical protein